jgi:histidinol phosphatase-like PHP family hydrolase
MATTIDTETGASATGTAGTDAQALEDRISRLLIGAVDMHCHSGPSVMARDLDHIEAIQEAADAGFRGLLIKDHYYSATPITELLKQTHGHLGVELFSGVPLNNSVGGFNKYAVDHGCALGANLVWMPTFSSRNHIDSPFGIRAGFPHTIRKMIPFDPLTPIDDNGEVKDEVKEILDLVAQYDVILSGGHLHVDEIFKVFEEARKRGVKRLLVNHPTFIIGATHEQIHQLVVELDAYIEHSLCMYVKLSNRASAFYPPEELDALIKAGTIERTILASDLGQINNDHPVAGFRNVIGECIGLGYSDEDIRKMISGNPLRLLGLEA